MLFSSFLFSALDWSCKWSAARAISAGAELWITSVGGGGGAPVPELDVGALRGAERARLDGMRRAGLCLWVVKDAVISRLFLFCFVLYGR